MKNHNKNNNDPGKRKYLNSPPPPSPPLPPPIGFAAMQNLTPEFFATLDSLGLEVVIVRLEAGKDSPVWKHDKIEDFLAMQLVADKAGNYDSSVFVDGVIYHFFHVSPLGKAMGVLKESLESLGLLSVAMLLHAESASELRVYYPPHDPQTQLIET